jgi:hypothetical protein
MIDYTNKESLRQFLEENGIQDPVQLNMLFRQITGVLLEEMLEIYVCKRNDCQRHPVSC